MSTYKEIVTYLDGTCEIYCRAIHNVDEIIQKLSISDCSIYNCKVTFKVECNH